MKHVERKPKGTPKPREETGVFKRHSVHQPEIEAFGPFYVLQKRPFPIGSSFFQNSLQIPLSQRWMNDEPLGFNPIA